MINFNEDLRMARVARNNARSKDYQVGAVLKCKNGNKYIGCNIENQGIQSICAERVAFASAIAQGETEFERILVIGGPKGKDEFEECLPCGYCRQFMNEYVDKDFKIYAAYGATLENGDQYTIDEYTIDDLLPHSFDRK